MIGDPGDVLAAIWESRGSGLTVRAGSDPSVVAVGYLIDYDSATNLSTVQVWDSGEIAGVPTTPSTYTSITTVYLLMEGGRPVQVLGPASDATTGEFGEIPAPPPSGTTTTRTVRGKVISPTWSGTYRVTSSAWDAWNVDTYGGRSDVYQYGSTPSGTLYGLATYGDQIVNLGAADITAATLTLASNGAGPSTWTATVQGSASSSKPAGAPTGTGSTATGTVTTSPGRVTKITLGSTMRDDLRDGTIKSLGLLTGATYGGTYGTGNPPGWCLSLDYTVTG